MLLQLRMFRNVLLCIVAVLCLIWVFIYARFIDAVNTVSYHKNLKLFTLINSVCSAIQKEFCVSETIVYSQQSAQFFKYSL